MVVLVHQVMAAGQTEASTSKPASDTEGEMSEQPEPSLSARHGLTDDQLMEVFKQTSIFNVKSALANNQNLMQNETAEDPQQEFFSDSDISDTEEWDYLRGFWSGENVPLPENFCNVAVTYIENQLQAVATHMACLMTRSTHWRLCNSRSPEPPYPFPALLRPTLPLPPYTS